LQPAERLWPLTNEALANRHFQDLDALQDAQAQRCLTLQRQPEVIRAHTSFHWWPRTACASANHPDLVLDWLGDEEDHEIEDDKEREAAIEAKILAKRRSSKPPSISDLVRFSGLQRSTVVEALRVLTTPIFGNREINGVKYPPISLVLKGEAQPRTPIWYAPNRLARNWYWPADFLNSPIDVSAARDMLWPFFLVHGDRARRRLMED
jgi:hypothetical protein